MDVILDGGNPQLCWLRDPWGHNCEIIRAIIQEYDLPMGTVAPADLNHPMLSAGPLMDTMV